VSERASDKEEERERLDPDDDDENDDDDAYRHFSRGQRTQASKKERKRSRRN
jgi:hypothetical protein